MYPWPGYVWSSYLCTMLMCRTLIQQPWKFSEDYKQIIFIIILSSQFITLHHLLLPYSRSPRERTVITALISPREEAKTN